MPDLTPVHITLLALTTVLGVVLGWLFRGNRSSQEKAAVSAGWQEQIEAQRVEHDRLTEQNKSLMEQINQLQASNRDAKNRAKELSDAVQDAYSRRDSLQRELKDIRTNLEKSMSERDQLQSSVDEQLAVSDDLETRNARIAKLESELRNWQDRLPPLLERFRERNTEVEQLKSEVDQLNADLSVARVRIRELEAMIDHGQTRIEPVEDPETLTDGRDASNDTLQAESSMIDAAAMLDDPETTSDTMATEAVNDHDALNGERDDLQRIKGVGPAIEKTLNELGITSFQQIADMSEYDIDRVANRLRGFRSRIYREDWIGQARELRDQQVDG